MSECLNITSRDVEVHRNALVHPWEHVPTSVTKERLEGCLGLELSTCWLSIQEYQKGFGQNVSMYNYACEKETGNLLIAWHEVVIAKRLLLSYSWNVLATLASLAILYYSSRPTYGCGWTPWTPSSKLSKKQLNRMDLPCSKSYLFG